MSDGKRTLIRNSTVEFLIFTGQAGEQSIEARYDDETLWLSQKLMAELFDVDVRTVSEHLKNIFSSGELAPEPTIRKFRIVQQEGLRNVARAVDFYNLDAIISVGYRVNSLRATQFRQWATAVLREFAIKGYVLDRQRMENGSFLGEDYFERLLAEIREIRLSERRFYQKITDIYATTPPASITTRMRRPPSRSSQRCRTSCTTQSTGTLPPNSSIAVRMATNPTWGCRPGRPRRRARSCGPT